MAYSFAEPPQPQVADVAQPVFEPVFEPAVAQAVVVNNVVTQPSSPRISKGVAVVLWLIVGGLGVHRFYCGDNGSGALLLVSFVLCFTLVWIPIHLVLVLADGILIACDQREIWRS